MKSFMYKDWDGAQKIISHIKIFVSSRCSYLRISIENKTALHTICLDYYFYYCVESCTFYIRHFWNGVIFSFFQIMMTKYNRLFQELKFFSTHHIFSCCKLRKGFAYIINVLKRNILSSINISKKLHVFCPIRKIRDIYNHYISFHVYIYIYIFIYIYSGQVFLLKKLQDF